MAMVRESIRKIISGFCQQLMATLSLMALPDLTD